MMNRPDYHLRPMWERDLEQVLTWRNSDRIRACMYTDDIISWEQHNRWFQSLGTRGDVTYQVCEFQQRAIGVVNATRIDRLNGSCDWGFYLGDETAPKGSSYAMGLLFLDWLFENFSLGNVYGEVLAFNTDSLRFHQNIGFERQGVLPHRVIKGGTPTDVIKFALSATRWQSVRALTAHRLFGPPPSFPS